jgi:hypothetical protein
MDEQFRQIEGYPAYRVSRDGEVQSCWSRGKLKRLSGDWHALKPVNRKRYLSVNLSNGVRKRRHYIHRLVLEAFVGRRPEGMVCCHYDGDPANNRLDNLRWDSYRANEEDKLRHGTRKFGSQTSAKLNEDEVEEIRKLKTQGITFAALAHRFGVSSQNIEAIVYRRSWRHLP